MINEIGSEFWLFNSPNECIDDSLSPDWIEVWGNNMLTSSGRGAISLMLKHIEDKVAYKTVLLPSYICESVIMPFNKAGYKCYFYDIDDDLKPDIESIRRFMKNGIGIFLHMGYFGFPTNENLHDCINQFNKKGTIIVEDVTHTLFSEYSRHNENNYYIASIRKWTGLPSGGFLASKRSDFREQLDIQINFSNIREEALLLKGEYIRSNDQKLKQKYLDMFNEGEEILRTDLRPYSIDRCSRSIINKLDKNKLMKKRRQNFEYLLNNFKTFKGITPVFNRLEEKVCPLFFPIYVENSRKQLREILIKEKIYCPIHWPKPSQIDILNFPLSKKIYNHILSIPCDQRYGIVDMARIIDVINDYYL